LFYAIVQTHLKTIWLDPILIFVSAFLTLKVY